MKLFKQIYIWSLFISISSLCQAQSIPTIAPKDAPNYVGKTVTVQSKVLSAFNPSTTLCILRFTTDKGGLSAVIPGAKYKDMLQAGIDLNSIEGKIVTVTGIIVKDPKYGYQMNLNDPSKQLLLPETATDVKYVSGNIEPADVPKYVGQYATVVGKVVKVELAKTGTTYLLRFTDQPKGFTVVVFPSLIDILKKSNIDLKSFEGKTVQVKGNIKFYEQYGYEIILDKPENLTLLK